MKEYFKYVACIIFIVFLVFLPSLNNQVLFWDDVTYLKANPLFEALSWQNLLKTFSALTINIYIPLTNLTFGLEHHFFPHNPFVLHFNNIILHAAVCVAIYFFILRLGFSSAVGFLTAVIFAVHPMHVESVAWITERKDVLYSFFYLLAILDYLNFLDRGKKTFYLRSLLWGTLSILAKPMALSLPIVLILLEWFYPHKRKEESRRYLRWLPFFLIMGSIAFLTYKFHARVPIQDPLQALLIWTWCFSFYLQKFFMPFDLSPLYYLPQPISLDNLEYIKGLAVAFFVAVLIVRFRENKLFLFSFLFYFCSIFFLLRFDPIDVQVVADRFMYLPSLGVCLFIAHGLIQSFNHFRERGGLFIKVYTLSIVLILGSLAISTFYLSGVWKSDMSLWTYNILVNPKSAVAYNNRAAAYVRQNQLDLALEGIDKAIALDPKYVAAYNNRGQVMILQKKYPEAIAAYTKTIQLKPEYPNAYFDRGHVYYLQQDYDRALIDYTKAIELNPAFAEAYNGRGELLTDLGLTQKAMTDIETSIVLNPNNPNFYINRANLLTMMNQFDVAMKDYERVIQMNPKSAPAYHNRGVLFAIKRDFQEALKAFSKAIELDPSDSDSYSNRGNVYGLLKEYDRAIHDFNKAIEINPDNKEVYKNRELTVSLKLKDLSLPL